MWYSLFSRFLLMTSNSYSIVPSADAHMSEYVAASDQRRQFMTG